MDSGVTTTELCRKLLAEFPGLTLITGGGVRDVEDLVVLAGAGIDAVLLASALHDGRISRTDIERVGGDHNTTVGWKSS
jgi:phosphoribosylformimino-5-aminoimidazole carboxamide ribotide isomerase